MNLTANTMTHTMERETTPQVHQMPAGYQALAHDAHATPNEDQITRVVFLIIMVASVLFIAATLFVTHM